MDVPQGEGQTHGEGISRMRTAQMWSVILG
jgi:hypothetical protein